MRSRRVAAVALLVSVCALVSTATALAATSIPSESLVTFEGQLNGHQVSKVTLFTKAHSFRVTLVDGHIVRVAFPSAEQQRLINDARAKGITVKVATGEPPSHKRRYIAGGVVIVLIVVGLLAYLRRRRTRNEE